jgi:diaminopimelate decarboxylase
MRPPRADPAWDPVWTDAARRFGTPLYVYDLPVMRERVTALERVLPEGAALHYAVKANGSLALVDQLRRMGWGAEVCSLGELETVRAARFTPDRVLYTGPAKSDRELTEAVSWGVGLIVVESVAEAERVASVASARQPVLLRVNPGFDLARSDIVTSPPSSKFGVDEAAAGAAVRRIRALPNILLRGIHVSTESNVRSAERLLERARYAFALAARLRDDRCPIDVVDLGGGLGASVDLDAYGTGLRRLLEHHRGLTAILEPGRYPVAESGAYVMSVVAVKRSAGRTFALVDGGINHLYRPRLTPAGSPPPVRSSSGAAPALTTVAGPLLDGDDLLAVDVACASPAVGDLLAIPHCGAYGYAHGLHAFCLHPTPAEALWDGERLHLIRERADPLTVTAGQYLLEHRAPAAVAR